MRLRDFVFSLSMLMTSAVSASEALLEQSKFYAANLNENFLRSETTKSKKPQLLVKKFNEVEGLYAGYRSTNGEKIIFRSQVLPNGSVFAAAFYWDKKTKSVKPVMAPSKVQSEPGGDYALKMNFPNLDVHKILQQNQLGKVDAAEKTKLQTFMQSNIGVAYNQGVIALYVLLESLETSPELAKLKAPFGIMRMAAELAGGHYQGFDEAEQLLDQSEASEMRQQCADDACSYKNKSFMLHKFGLFDILSKRSDVFSLSSLQHCSQKNKSIVADAQAQQAQTSHQHVENHQNECMGCCGPDCWGCTGIYTDECLGHDICVGNNGHANCMYSAAIGNSLIEAVGSFLGAIGSAIADFFGWNAIGGGNGACDFFVTCSPWEDWDYWNSFP